MKFFLSLVLIFLSSLAVAETSIEPKPFTYPFDVKVYDLPVSANGIQYRLFIRPPLREPAEGEKATTIYVLDALRLFVPASSMSYNYEYFNYMPSSYFVGIGYVNEQAGQPRTENRTRDYTPTRFEPPNQNHFLASAPADYEGSGGTDAFLDAIESQVIPFIESEFKVANNDRVLVGNSMSGLAAVHALLARPRLFNRYLIVSPAIWWDDWMLGRNDRYVMKQQALSSRTALKDETRVYFAVGDSEERLRLVTDLHVLVDALRQRRDGNLKVFLDVLENETHEGVFPAAFMRGIVGLYVGEPDHRPSASNVSW